jgi:hypothetical protein
LSGAGGSVGPLSHPRSILSCRPQAATVTTPTVDLIDGDKLCDLVRDQQIGLRIVAQVDEGWFDRFDA